MISFRYHIVSIVAVFLALALGHRRRHHRPERPDHHGPAPPGRRRSRSERDTLAEQVKTLQGQVDDAGQFASTYGSQLVAGTLTKAESCWWSACPARPPACRTASASEIAAAGGKVSGKRARSPTTTSTRARAASISVAGHRRRRTRSG